MSTLNEYEAVQLQAIADWKDEEPSVISRSLGTVSAPISWLARKTILEAAIRKAIDTVDFAAIRLTDGRAIVRSAGVGSIDELRSRDLQLSDGLADRIHNQGIALAVAEGTATGFGGWLTLAADIPAVILLALKTIYEIGLCYGFDFQTGQDRQFILGVLAVSSANSIGDKRFVLEKLRRIELMPLHPDGLQASYEPVRLTGGRPEPPGFDFDYLTRTLGMNLTKRKVLQMIPVVGALVGGSVNGWYLRDIGWAARRNFQERWLLENHKVSPSKDADDSHATRRGLVG